MQKSSVTADKNQQDKIVDAAESEIMEQLTEHYNVRLRPIASNRFSR